MEIIFKNTLETIKPGVPRGGMARGTALPKFEFASVQDLLESSLEIPSTHESTSSV
jgi:hypothetical protein